MFCWTWNCAAAWSVWDCSGPQRSHGRKVPAPRSTSTPKLPEQAAPEHDGWARRLRPVRESHEACSILFSAPATDGSFSVCCLCRGGGPDRLPLHRRRLELYDHLARQSKSWRSAFARAAFGRHLEFRICRGRRDSRISGDQQFPRRGGSRFLYGVVRPANHTRGTKDRRERNGRPWQGNGLASLEGRRTERNSGSRLREGCAYLFVLRS